MKYVLSIVCFVLQVTAVIGQDLQLSDIVGTYEGKTLNKTEQDYQLRINTDASFVFSVKNSGLWVGIITGKLEKKKFFITDEGGATYEFNITDSPEGYNSLIIGLLKEATKSKLNISGVFVSISQPNDLPQTLDMNRKGGNPVLKIMENLTKYEGTTPNWGKCTIIYNASLKEAVISFDKVYNKFIYQKKDNIHIITSIINQKEFINVQYEHDANRKTMKLLTTPKLGVLFFSKAMVFKQKNTSQYIDNQVFIPELVANLFYELIDEKFKPNDLNVTNNMVIFMDEHVYVGGLKDEKLEGQGTLFYDVETHKGSFVNNLKQGAFDLMLEEGQAIAYFDKGKKTGVWKLTNDSGDVTEITFEDDKKVNSKIIKNPKCTVKHDLGIMVNQNNEGDQLYVSSIDESSPIYKAGMRMGDNLYRINKVSVSKLKRAEAQNKLTYTSTDYFELEFFAKVWDKQMIVRVFPETKTYKKIKTTAKNPVFRKATLKRDAEQTFTDYIKVDEQIANAMSTSQFDNKSFEEVKKNIENINQSLEKLQAKQVKMQVELLSKYEAALDIKCKWLIKYTQQAITANQKTVQYLNETMLNFVHATTLSTKEEAKQFMFGATDVFGFAKGSIQELKKHTQNAHYANCY